MFDTMHTQKLIPEHVLQQPFAKKGIRTAVHNLTLCTAAGKQLLTAALKEAPAASGGDSNGLVTALNPTAPA
jgi:hypothetical protein